MRYAVAIMSLSNDNLLVQIIEADSIKEAVKKTFNLQIRKYATICF